MKYIDEFNNTYDLTFYRGRYADNGRPLVLAWCEEGPYADVTVNIFAPLTAIDGYHVHADTNNVGHLVDWMCGRGLMTRTGLVGRSGWCEYPEVELDHEWFDSLPEARF